MDQENQFYHLSPRLVDNIEGKYENYLLNFIFTLIIMSTFTIIICVKILYISEYDKTK